MAAPAGPPPPPLPPIEAGSSNVRYSASPSSASSVEPLVRALTHSPIPASVPRVHDAAPSIPDASPSRALEAVELSALSAPPAVSVADENTELTESAALES